MYEHKNAVVLCSVDVTIFFTSIDYYCTLATHI